ncbi:hypothetical protein [Roseospira navarrensis]|uniref:Uncharacterized protein n=1 Tax=Roseospira navarrensis TaxID=140058 RepID=A0A7X1ZHG1_9PROT|nr:hypothetical protein [Roseospira navarrensis]MQX37562.1 hypothetical protein [Roseospira navarrensis]
MTDQAAANKDKVLEAHRLVGTDEPAATPADRRPWTRHAIYRSRICIATHLSFLDPECRMPGDVDEPKAALFRYLRQVQQTVMDHGLILPLAVVIEVPKQDPETLFVKALKRWGSDQTWHRGGFTLYLEEPGEAVKRRLHDLLNPTAEAMQGLTLDEPHDQAWYAARLEGAAQKAETNSHPWAADLARLCAQHLENDQPAPEMTNGVPALNDWKSQKLQEIRDLADGSARP